MLLTNKHIIIIIIIIIIIKYKIKYENIIKTVMVPTDYNTGILSPYFSLHILFGGIQITHRLWEVWKDHLD